jgi:hypothetical protein
MEPRNGCIFLRKRCAMAYNAPNFFTSGPASTMIESDIFVQSMQDMGVNFFTGVPDSILGGIIAELMDRRLYTPAVRED